MTGLTEIIASASFIISILAVIYARWSWKEAKIANDLSLHEKKEEIYKAFDNLRFAVMQKAVGIKHEDTSKFYFHSRNAEFYFNKDLYTKIKRYFDVCFGLAELDRKLKTRNLTEEETKKIYGEQDKLLEEESRLAKEINDKLIEELKVYRKGNGILMP